MTATFRLATAAALVAGLLAGCGQAALRPAGAPVPGAYEAAGKARDGKDVAQRLLEEKLNAEGAEFGEIEEVQLMETAKAGVYHFTLTKVWQDEYQNSWQDSYAGTVDTKRKTVKAKRTKREEV